MDRSSLDFHLWEKSEIIGTQNFETKIRDELRYNHKWNLGKINIKVDKVEKTFFQETGRKPPFDIERISCSCNGFNS